ncbi:MAG: outer membrane lipoprotein-sorting protein [bacterium]|nr:outer membrane lipoprotein-sorting protein [bacterium]
MVLNLVTANPVYKAGVNAKAATIKKTSKKKKSVTYMVELPQEQLGQKVDLYKIRYDDNGGNTRVGVEALRKKKKKLKITFDGVKKDDKTYFVLVNGAQGTALVHGMKSVTKKPLPVNLSGQSESEWSSRKDMEKELRDMKPEKGAELQKLLEGAAGYCEKLKKAAFHYTCKEKIVETLKPFTRVSNIDKDIAKSGIDRNQVLHIQAPRRSMNAIKNDKYVFNYLLLKKGQNVKEDRDLLSMKLSKNEKGKAKKDTEAIIKGIRFLSRKAVFGPITLLSAERQAKYNFRLLNYAKLKGRKVAVIEALPKKENAAIFLYGKIWLDTGDFSILKIKANPNSILGYKKLLDLAGELNARLRLNLETEFYKLREGIRFPTMVRFDENYKGGTFITQHMGTKGWERSKTIINYVKYLFYNVGVDVSYE